MLDIAPGADIANLCCTVCFCIVYIPIAETYHFIQLFVSVLGQFFLFNLGMLHNFYMQFISTKSVPQCLVYYEDTL